MHGGKATHDTIDAPQMATRLRGGMLPQAYGYPAEMRAPRDLLRRRRHLLRTRAALFSHVQQTNSQDNLPESGTNLASKANRGGVAARLAEAAVPKKIEVDVALITYDDALRRDLELAIIQTAKNHEANTLYLRHTVPGLGQILRRVRRYDIPAMARCPRGQDFVSSGRLVTCAKASAGKRWGTSGKNIGNAPLQWACSAAAALVLRTNPHGHKYLVRVEKKPDPGQALTILAPKRARAVYDRLTRQTACDRDMCRRTEESRAGEPEVSRDTQGKAPESSVLTVLFHGVLARQGVPLGPVALSLTD